MRKIFLLLSAVWLCSSLHAQTPQGKKFGLGIMLGDPTGLTAKIAVSRENEITLSAGTSYFGSLRLGIDYTWRFDVFRSPILHLYTGPGAVVGIGHSDGFIYKSYNGRFYFRPAGESGLAVRGIVGLDFTLQHDPIEFFFEVGPLVGIIPAFGSSMDAAIGIRFYP
ncbi:MAG: hypothetical protein PHP42_12065 [Bacteroidota bacterium]|nr:hypothetical protein [Bacteroidota bacterium]